MRGPRGFTFLELLMVIIIIGVMAGFAVPSVKKTYDTFALQSFVKDLYYTARYLQSSAASQRKNYRLDINPSELTFQMRAQKDDSYVMLTGRFKKRFRVPKGVTLNTQPLGLKEIYFYPDGSMDSATLVFKFRDKDKVSLVLQGASGGIKIQ
jgi:type II secretion system protein H